MTPNFSYLICLLVYGLSLSQLLVFCINMRKLQSYSIYSLKSFQSKYYYRPSISKTTCFLILLSCGRLRWQQLNGSVEKIRKQAISAYILRAWLNVSCYVSYIWEESGPIHMYDLCYVCVRSFIILCYVFCFMMSCYDIYLCLSFTQFVLSSHSLTQCLTPHLMRSRRENMRNLMRLNTRQMLRREMNWWDNFLWEIDLLLLISEIVLISDHLVSYYG